MAYIFKNEPYQHQRDVLLKSWNKEAWAWFLEMGTGKTFISLNNAGILFERELIDTLIVLAPKGVFQNWSSIEIPKHLPERIERNVVVWRPSPNKKQKEALTDLITESSVKLKILVMNIESLSTKKGLNYLEMVLKANKAMLVIDESTTIKSPTAKRTKSLLKLAKLAHYRRILSGFPVTQSPMDLWSQCKFLGDELLGAYSKSFHHFQHHYAIIKRQNMGGHSFNMVVGYRNLDELSETLKGFSSRVTKEECLDLPPKNYITRDIELTEDQGRIYMELKEYCVAHLEDAEFMTTNNVMTQLIRMQQVLSGHTKSDSGELIEIKNNRLNELLSCCAEISGKIVIFSRFRYDIQNITRELNKVYGLGAAVSYYGDTDNDARVAAIDDFQEGKARFFVSNPVTGGYGITLTASQTVIYYANSFDLSSRMQSESRIHRMGQEGRCVTYIDFVCRNSIDEQITKALKSKMDISLKVLGEQLENWLQ